MKYLFAYLFVCFLALGCKTRVLKGPALKNKLAETMGDYLHTTLQPGATFVIKDVIFYPEVTKKLYDCEFIVTIHYGNQDSTGTISATISDDFKTVVKSH